MRATNAALVLDVEGLHQRLVCPLLCNCSPAAGCAALSESHCFYELMSDGNQTSPDCPPNFDSDTYSCGVKAAALLIKTCCITEAQFLVPTNKETMPP